MRIVFALTAVYLAAEFAGGVRWPWDPHL